MKLKLSLAKAALMLLAISAGSAKADWACQVSLNQLYWWNGNYVQTGHSFAYMVNIGIWPQAGPLSPEYGYGINNLSIAFYGTGIDPQGPGEVYPGPYVAGGQSSISGFYNPGGLSGTYTRYAVVRWPNGGTYCTTDPIDVTLE
jgi:hypothetical protein